MSSTLGAEHQPRPRVRLSVPARVCVRRTGRHAEQPPGDPEVPSSPRLPLRLVFGPEEPPAPDYPRGEDGHGEEEQEDAAECNVLHFYFPVRGRGPACVSFKVTSLDSTAVGRVPSTPLQFGGLDAECAPLLPGPLQGAPPGLGLAPRRLSELPGRLRPQRFLRPTRGTLARSVGRRPPDSACRELFYDEYSDPGVDGKSQGGLNTRIDAPVMILNAKMRAPWSIPV
jgi:hypothetical protein